MSEPLPPHVLVINDERDILALFRELLEEEGYRVSTLTYPVAELGDIQILAPDLLILDMLFGGEDRGWQFLQQLRLTRATAGLPVIVCTAATRLVRDVQDYLSGMGIGVVLKPFDIDPFLAEVRRRLAQGRADRTEA
jgi:DNA-binding response OmpR family regulator